VRTNIARQRLDRAMPLIIVVDESENSLSVAGLGEQSRPELLVDPSWPNFERNDVDYAGIVDFLSIRVGYNFVTMSHPFVKLVL